MTRYSTGQYTSEGRSDCLQYSTRYSPEGWCRKRATIDVASTEIREVRPLPRGRVTDATADDDEAVAGGTNGEVGAEVLAELEEWPELGASEVEVFEAGQVVGAIGSSVGAD